MNLRRFCFFLLMALSAPSLASADESSPRLLLLLTIDQGRGDYLERFRPALSGGLARLVDEGVVFTDAHHAHAHTVTAPGHAALSTGRHPGKLGDGRQQLLRSIGRQMGLLRRRPHLRRAHSRRSRRELARTFAGAPFGNGSRRLDPIGQPRVQGLFRGRKGPRLHPHGREERGRCVLVRSRNRTLGDERLLHERVSSLGAKLSARTARGVVLRHHVVAPPGIGNPPCADGHRPRERAVLTRVRTRKSLPEPGVLQRGVPLAVSRDLSVRFRRADRHRGSARHG